MFRKELALGISGLFHPHSNDITDSMAARGQEAAVDATPPRRRARP